MLALAAAHDHRIGELAGIQVAEEFGLAHQVVDAQPQVGGPAQEQQLAGHAVEPDDLAQIIEDDDAIGQRGRGALDLPEQLHEALLVEALAPMQPHDLGDDLAPGAADIGRFGKAAVPDPPLDPEQGDELPAQVGDTGETQPGPRTAQRPAQQQSERRHGEQPQDDEQADLEATGHPATPLPLSGRAG